MNDLYSDKFINSLRLKDIIGIKTIPKADLHNHFVLGGNQRIYKKGYRNRYSLL